MTRNRIICLVSAFFLATTQANAFDLNVSKKVMMLRYGKTTAADLVVGDRSFISIFSLCSQDSSLALVSDAENETPSLYAPTLRVTRLPGNAFSAEVNRETVSDANKLESFLLTMSRLQRCSRFLETDPTRTLFEIQTVNGFAKFSELAESLLNQK